MKNLYTILVASLLLINLSSCLITNVKVPLDKPIGKTGSELDLALTSS